MGLIFRLVELLILLVPLAGVLYGGWRAFSAARARQDERREPRAAPEPQRATTAVHWQAIARAVKEHDRTDTRWLEYELDLAKLLDFPLMTDMRDPLTERFHRTKLRADLLRPAKAEDLVDGGAAAREYVDAVTDYVTAFDAAENEAVRRRRSDFSTQEQQRLARAQNMLLVATDTAATPQERERAYELARRELDGLIVLPERARAAIEQGIAGELDG
ncbi:hypothetical protein A5765_18295 [Mycolicibacterium celeriflavum]|uniref:Uncharacterized protein n=1 Tax=Mycolicibacterium celeriflavum TaxID=1249101 RepID=A0A1X0C153_MYCCF|nr:hypothetical protein [Mycolicibacterium celeriflavum]MCV7238382.1 hypothetical protein [Mycolicibacterium celeriflavum]OBG23856.1 hypothetical protein A5765_18295 [Mycolicibacterium celeriflavum]ORA50946.1 hypothetical protein BST21_01975 [Mycolicibacterium celeriflavum]BBY44809.1 hypothetical protein MCEL_31040 [Mycolicibacterium celeriflavum]